MAAARLFTRGNFRRMSQDCRQTRRMRLASRKPIADVGRERRQAFRAWVPHWLRPAAKGLFSALAAAVSNGNFRPRLWEHNAGLIWEPRLAGVAKG